MKQVEKHCIISIFWTLYADGGRKEKRQILAEVCERVNIGRRQARLLLEKRPPGRPRKTRDPGTTVQKVRRPGVYTGA